MSLFTQAYRDLISEHVLQMAANDPRVISAAVVGSLAFSDGDRWSDLDLTFAVADEFPMLDVLHDWTRNIQDTCNAVRLFDLPAGDSIYRVFLLPGCLQFDLSFTPASKFGATGPKFRLLYGKSVEKPFSQSQPLPDMLGYAVHHLLRARFCLERGRLWQAEYWISSARGYALSLACQRRGLPSSNGRGFDQLPGEVLDAFSDSFANRVEKTALLQALYGTINALLSEEAALPEIFTRVKPLLLELISPAISD